MTFEALARLAASRDRLAAPPQPPRGEPPTATGSTSARLGPFHGPVDVIVTLCELNGRHGTGVLVQRLFGAGASIVTVRSRDLYGGEQDFGARRTILAHGEATRAEVFSSILDLVAGLQVRRILAIPYKHDDVRSAIALKAITGAPLLTWIMDDQNVEATEIPDAPLRELLERCELRLAISAEMRGAYQSKYGLSFHLAPPAAPPAHLLRHPAAADAGRLAARHGLVVGNIWGERWLDDLLEALRGSGVALDWHSAGGCPWMKIDEDRLAAAGLRLRGHLPEPELVAALRASPFVVVPSGTFEGEDSHRFVARLSLPSRIPYVAATSGTPVVVVGHPETAAARFVRRHDLGVVTPYDRRAFRAAIDGVCTAEAQARHRAAAAALAPALSSAGMASWLWNSLALGRPADDRFAPLERT